ncbi:glycosyltransferase family 4 protein [Metallosphaera yellowstonensis]|nr:glycosyltransferase family 4 protein [Metallosphaera yellowstonensis]
MEEGKEMKIIQVSHSFYPTIGGIEKVVYEISKRLSKKHEVEVVTSSKVPRDVSFPFNIIRIPSLNILGMSDLTIPLTNRIETMESDVIHFHSQNSLFSALLLHKNQNSVVSVMALESLSDHPNPFIRRLSPVYNRLTARKIIKISKTLIVKNMRDLKMLRERYGRPAHLVPDGVDDKYLTTGKTTSFYDEIGENYVLYVGRLHKLKGIEVLLKASRWIKSKVVIAGPGDLKYYEKLSRKLGVNDKVKFLGYIDENVKIKVIDSAELVIIPSVSDYAEAFSIVLSEAWSREKAVVASDVGSLGARITHGRNGLLVPPSNPRILAETVNQVLDDTELRTEMGLRGRKEVVGWDTVVFKLEEIYRGMEK